MWVHLYAAVIFEVWSLDAGSAVGVEIIGASLIVAQSRKHADIVYQVIGHNATDADSTDIIGSASDVLCVAYILFEEVALEALQAVAIWIIGETVSNRVDALAVH